MYVCTYVHTRTYLCAGGPSIIILIHRICIAFRGLGHPNTIDNVIRDNADILLRKEGNGWWEKRRRRRRRRREVKDGKEDIKKGVKKWIVKI